MIKVVKVRRSLEYRAEKNLTGPGEPAINRRCPDFDHEAPLTPGIFVSRSMKTDILA